MSANESDGRAYLALAAQGSDRTQVAVWIAYALVGEGSRADLAALWPMAVRK